MRALLLQEGGRFELAEAPPPDTQPGWALVRTIASSAGLFHAQMAAGMLPTAGFPRVLGHEIFGEVITAPSAASPPPGALVVADAVVGCGVCEWCVRGSESICPWMRHLGIDLDGGFAEIVGVPESNIFELPAGTPPGEAVMLGSALPASVHAVLRAGIGAGSRVVVSGVGSIGLTVCQVARAFGASSLAALDVADDHLEAARPWADATINVSGLSPGEILEALRDVHRSQHGADAAIEAAGVPSSVDLCFKAARPGGTVLLMGICDGAATLSFDSYLGEFIRRELRVITTFGFTRNDFLVGNALYEAGRLDMSRLVGGTLKLEEVPQALEDISSHGTGGKRYLVDVAIV